MLSWNIQNLFPLRFLLWFPAFVLFGCADQPTTTFQGYVEGDFVYVSPPAPGMLQSLSVHRGSQVLQGAPLFDLDPHPEAETVAEARQELSKAEHQLANATKGLRPTEVKALQARLQEAEAARDLARAELERREQLFSRRYISAEELNQTQTAWQQAEASVLDLSSQIATARLGERGDLIKAAKSEVAAARERLTRALWVQEEKSQTAPVSGVVFDTFFEVGEYVPAARPVVSLLPPGQIKVRFFVPQQVVGTLQTGQQVFLSFDGAEMEFPAHIDFIAPEVEYTPPVIFSRETRAKLVMMLEARPEPGDATKFHPGQPVTVRLTQRHD